MKTLLRLMAVSILALAPVLAPVLAQEHPPEGKEHSGAAASGHSSEAGHDAGDPYIMWKWINFGILAAALGYLMAKNLPAFFAERNAEIQKELTEARQLKAEADRRVTEVEQRMARMETEIEQLRANARTEMASEGERIRKETQDLIAKVKAGAENEILSVTKMARQDLKVHSARLALEMAEQRIRGKIGSADGALVDGFIRELERKGALN